MIERIIYTAIEQGLAVLNADPRAISDLFKGQLGLAQAEAEKIRLLWVDDQAETDESKRRFIPSLNHGYPHGEVDFPGFFITLTSEGEETHFLGDETGQYLDDPSDEDYGSPIVGSIWEQTTTILVVAQHADVTVYLYQLLKAILVSQDAFIKSCGAIKAHYSGGDMAPDKSWTPAGFFVRRMTINTSTEYNVVVPDGMGRAWKVAGIHLEASGAPGELTGGVKTLVTIAEEDSDV